MFRFILGFFRTIERSTQVDFAEQVKAHHTKEWEETDWTKIYLA